MNALLEARGVGKRFGGGGHARAAGALIPGSLDTVRTRVVAEAREYLATADALGPLSAR